MGKPSLCISQPFLLLPKAIHLSPPRSLSFAISWSKDENRQVRPGPCKLASCGHTLGDSRGSGWRAQEADLPQSARDSGVGRGWGGGGVDGEGIGRRWGAHPAVRVSGVRSFARLGAVAPGPFPGVLPLGPSATEPRGRILTCQTRPGRVYNSPALAPGAVASPALRWDSGRAPRARRQRSPGSKPARRRPLALARALTRARSHSHCLSPRALTLKHVLSHFAHALTLALACSHLHTCARSHKRTFTRSDSHTRATRTSAHTLTPARLPCRGAGTAGESAERTHDLPMADLSFIEDSVAFPEKEEDEEEEEEGVEWGYEEGNPQRVGVAGVPGQRVRGYAPRVSGAAQGSASR